MKILHLTGSMLSKRSGITGVLLNLPLEQNKIAGVESRVVIVDNVLEGEYPDYIKSISIKELADFLDNYHPDLIIIHDFYVPNYRKISRIIRKKHIPYFLEPHGAFGRFAMKKSHFKKVLANNTYFRELIKKASGIVFTTKREREDSVYHNKVETIIENGIQKSIVENSIKNANKNYNDPVFYFMGRFKIFHKGLDYMLDALDILNKGNVKINFNIYGTSEPNEIEYVETRVKALTNINVKCCGTVYGPARDDVLNNQNNILVLTSRYEGSPLAVLDALSYGNPAVVTPGTNVSKQVVDNQLGWETPLEAQAIADTILIALEDYLKNGLEYVKRTREFVLNNFTWEKMGQKSIEEYKKLLKQLEK